MPFGFLRSLSTVGMLVGVVDYHVSIVESVDTCNERNTCGVYDPAVDCSSLVQGPALSINRGMASFKRLGVSGRISVWAACGCRLDKSST